MRSFGSSLRKTSVYSLRQRSRNVAKLVYANSVHYCVYMAFRSGRAEA